MSEISVYLPGILLAYSAFFLAIASPGPNVLAVIGTSMGVGRTSGLALALGVAAGSFLWALLTACGLSALLASYASALTAIKIAGGLYLLWLALQGVPLGGGGSRHRGRHALRRDAQPLRLFHPRPHDPDDQSQGRARLDRHHLARPAGERARMGRFVHCVWNVHSFGDHPRGVCAGVFDSPPWCVSIPVRAAGSRRRSAQSSPMRASGCWSAGRRYVDKLYNIIRSKIALGVPVRNTRSLPAVQAICPAACSLTAGA